MTKRTKGRDGERKGSNSEKEATEREDFVIVCNFHRYRRSRPAFTLAARCRRPTTFSFSRYIHNRRPAAVPPARRAASLPSIPTLRDEPTPSPASDSIVISLTPAEQSKTWRQHYPRPRLRLPFRRGSSVTVCRAAARARGLPRSSFYPFPLDGRWPLLWSLGRSDCRPFGLCLSLSLSFPFPFVLPKPPRKILCA